MAAKGIRAALEHMAYSKSIRAALGVALIGAVACLVDSGQLIDAFKNVSLQDVCILVALSGLLIAVSVLKWSAFLAHLGIRASFVKLFCLYLVGYFVNIFTPSFIGGDVVRSLALGPTVNRAHAVSATFLERYTGIVAMIAMAVVASLFSDAVTPHIVGVVMLAAFGCALGTWMIIARIFERIGILSRFPEKFRRMVSSVHDGLVIGLQDRGLLGKALGLSLLFHLLTIVNTAAVARAVGWTEIPWVGLLVVVPLILLVGAVPVSPQGLGIQEGAFVFFLHSVGASTGQALAIALVLRAKSYLLALCGGIVWIFRSVLLESTEEQGG